MGLKILIRLIMIIFLMGLPVYKVYTFRIQYLEKSILDSERASKLTGEFQENFLLRSKEFYIDDEYKREFEKLQTKK